MPLRRRGLFVAASGVPAAMYGIASAPLSNSALLALSAAAFSAVWRSNSRCAKELALSLFVPWRADPIAVSIVQPWLALHHALLAGVVQIEDFPFIWECQHKAGPLRSCADSARRSGVVFDPDTCCFNASGVVCALLTSPEHHVREFLLAALTVKV